MQSIGFENFKCFKNRANFEFRNITILTGTNNSGKSSLLSGLEFLKHNLVTVDKNQNLIDNCFAKELEMVSTKLKLNSIHSLVNKESKKNDFSYFIQNGELDYEFRIEVPGENDLLPLAKFTSIKVKFIKEDIPFVNTELLGEGLVFSFDFVQLKNRYYTAYIDKLDFTKKAITDLKELLLVKYKSFQQGEIQKVEMANLFIAFNKKYNQQIACDEIIFDDNIYSEPVYDYLFDEKGIYGETALIQTENILSFENYKKLNNKKPLEIDFEELIQKFRLDIDKYKKMNSDFVSYYKRDDFFPIFISDLFKYLSNLKWESKKYQSHNNFFSKFIYNSFEDVKDSLKLFFLKELAANFNIIEADEGRFKIVQNDNPFNEDFNTVLKSFLEFIKLFFYSISEFNWDKNDDIGKITLFENLNLFFEPIENINLNSFNNRLLDIEKISISRADFSKNYSISSSTEFSKILKRFIIRIKKGIDSKNWFFINKWINEFGIADNLILDKKEGEDEFKILLVKENEQIELTEYGLGTNQILPLIIAACSFEIPDYDTSISLSGGRRRIMYPYDTRFPILIIEEPEANLHPALQSKLADFFAEVIERFNIELIIETHSEYLIRKLQYLVASNKSTLKKDDVVIYYLYPPNHPDVVSGEVEQVKKIEILEDGYLSDDFGTGFFDEAQKIAISLFGLNKSQKN